MTQKDPQNTQAIAERDNKALQRIETVEALSIAFDEEKHIILAPKTVLSGGLPAGMMLSIREVKADMDDTYWMPRKNGKEMCGLPKTLLMQISDAAGLEWSDPIRTDDRKNPHYCEWTAKAVKKGLDGSRTPYTDAKCVDLRQEAAPGIMGKDYEEMIEAAKAANKAAKAKAEKDGRNYKERDPMDQIRQARKFISEICVTKAMNRVISNATGTKRSYPKKDLETKTFIIAKLVPDTRDPDAKRAVLAEAMGASQAMFGQPADAPVVDADFVEEGTADPSSGEESVGDPPPSPTDSNAQSEEAPTGTQEVIDVIKSAWTRAHDGEMEPDVFRKLCVDSTGKNNKDEMHLGDAKQVGAAVDAWLKEMKQGELPV